MYAARWARYLLASGNATTSEVATQKFKLYILKTMMQEHIHNHHWLNYTHTHTERVEEKKERRKHTFFWIIVR